VVRGREEDRGAVEFIVGHEAVGGKMAIKDILTKGGTRNRGGKVYS